MTILSRLLPVMTCAYSVQLFFALIFVPQQNETYFDFGGAVGWISTTLISLYYPTLSAILWKGTPIVFPPIYSFAPRQILLSAALIAWSLRMGTFLTLRAVKAGGDARFDHIKCKPVKFTIYWLAQATWITLVGLPVYLCNISQEHPPLGVRDYAAFSLYILSLLLEATADHQKSAWKVAKKLKQHDEEFISSGLWSISRHPNYLGELGIWTGIWALSTASLQTKHYPSWTVAATVCSPLFTWFLVQKVSGIPPLERQGNKKFGQNPKWLKYKSTVPIFWPWSSPN